jgi:hypothetical protein
VKCGDKWKKEEEEEENKFCLSFLSLIVIAPTCETRRAYGQKKKEKVSRST